MQSHPLKAEAQGESAQSGETLVQHSFQHLQFKYSKARSILLITLLNVVPCSFMFTMGVFLPLYNFN